MQHLRKVDKLNVGHKALSRLDALDGVFVYVHAVELKPGGKAVLGQSGGLPKNGDILSADVVRPVFCLIDEHVTATFLKKTKKMTFTACHFGYSML